MQPGGRIFHSARVLLLGRALSPLLLLAALAACSDRPTQPASRARDVPRSDTRAASGTASDRYMVLAHANGFGAAFDSIVASLGGTIVTRHDGTGFAVVSGLSADAAKRLAARNEVADVEPDALVSLNAPVVPAMADLTAVKPPTILDQGNPTLALGYAWQWNMRDIGAEAAWAAGRLGDSGVTVAIIDSGIDYDDPDLDGLVDLARSVSFVTSDNQLRATYFPTRHDISDFAGHGTNIASQVSSKAFVFAGVTSRTTLMGVKVLGWNGVGQVSDLLNGIVWAADHGADVANISLGSSFVKTAAGRLLSITMRIANYANRRGMLMVVAAGNDATDLDHDGNHFAALCNVVHVVCVSAVGPATASGPLDTPAFYTNFGRSAISVAGPGGNADFPSFTPSVWPWGLDVASRVWSICSKTTLAGVSDAGVPILAGCQHGDKVIGGFGTSGAAPHVSGLAALLVADHGHGQPGLLKSIIEGSAVDLGSPGTDPYFGRGRISVPRALGVK